MKKFLTLAVTLCMMAALFSIPGITAFANEGDAGESAAAFPAAENLPAEGAVYLAFTGDQHGETETYREWIETTLSVYGDQLALLSYSGDICDKNWEQPVYDEFKSMIDELVPGRYNITTGNQEFKDGAPGNDWDALGEGFTRIGEVQRTEDYIVYDLGSAQEKLSLPQADVDTLAAYLADAPKDIPIFIFAHYPLHLAVETEDVEIPGPDSYRQQTNNEALLDVLNNYPNVIFLWGHNHTFGDPRYGTIRPAGSKFTYTFDDPTAKTELGFTYANYGSFCRGDTYGVMAEVLRKEEGVQVTMYFVDEDVPDESRDRAQILIGADGTVSSQVIDGTGIDLDLILAMSGYPDDPMFNEEF